MCTLELRATHTELRRQLLSQVLVLLHMLRMHALWWECSYVALVKVSVWGAPCMWTVTVCTCDLCVCTYTHKSRHVSVCICMASCTGMHMMNEHRLHACIHINSCVHACMNTRSCVIMHSCTHASWYEQMWIYTQMCAEVCRCVMGLWVYAFVSMCVIACLHTHV